MKTQMYVRPMTEMIRVQTAAQLLHETSTSAGVAGGGEYDNPGDPNMD